MLDLMLKQTSKFARRLLISGRVQGVGYRPFAYRLAHDLSLKGWVRNVTGRVEIHAEGSLEELERFVLRLSQDAPAISRPQLECNEEVAVAELTDFRILESQGGEADIHVPQDYFTCEDCLDEMDSPTDRRYRYPFINCPQCGPRYTLIESLPYDRPRTSMKDFTLFPACLSEYENPLDRRFHAEPVACPVCGPRLTFLAKQDPSVAGDQAALSAAVAALLSGQILAVKGVGGYHLMCDARRDDAVARLRARKPRPAKPLAVLFPGDGLALAQAVKLEAETERD